MLCQRLGRTLRVRFVATDLLDVVPGVHAGPQRRRSIAYRSQRFGFAERLYVPKILVDASYSEGAHGNLVAIAELLRKPLPERRVHYPHFLASRTVADRAALLG